MGGRGRRHAVEVRRKLLEEEEQHRAHGVKQKEFCEAVGLSVRTFQRWWKAGKGGSDQRKGPDSISPRALTVEEKTEIVRIANSPKYRDLTPEQIVPKLAEKGVYICSESSLRRELKKLRQNTHRGNRKGKSVSRKPVELLAKGPLQVLCWDITLLKNAVIRGSYFYLYAFQDVWSRKLLRLTVHSSQCPELAAKEIGALCEEHQVVPHKISLHSDNGSPMKGLTMLKKLEELGIAKSFSRPSVSDDNPYIESLFGVMKYVPEYPPQGFSSLQEAQVWVDKFLKWYNESHLHSSIGYVTPSQRCSGEDEAIFAKRQATYLQAKERHPERWARSTRIWKKVREVALNPEPHTRLWLKERRLSECAA